LDILRGRIRKNAETNGGCQSGWDKENGKTLEKMD